MAIPTFTEIPKLHKSSPESEMLMHMTDLLRSFWLNSRTKRPFSKIQASENENEVNWIQKKDREKRISWDMELRNFWKWRKGQPEREAQKRKIINNKARKHADLRKLENINLCQPFLLNIFLSKWLKMFTHQKSSIRWCCWNWSIVSPLPSWTEHFLMEQAQCTVTEKFQINH